MSPEKKKQWVHDILELLAVLGLLIFTVRLWPILLLLLLGIVFYGLWTLFHAQKQPVKVEPMLLPMLPAPTSEQSVMTAAFGLLQRKITEQVVSRYPNARWVWSVSDAYDRFASGQELVILLNSAGGYQRATVVVRELQFAELIYETAPSTGTPPKQDDTEHGPGEEEETTVDYGLLAFEWVEANLQRLNVQGNEAIAAGANEFRIPAEELPHGDSWPTVCEELIRNGFAAAEAMADGIHVKLKTGQESERHEQ